MSSVVDKPQAARSFLSYFIAITKMRNIGQHEVISTKQDSIFENHHHEEGSWWSLEASLFCFVFTVTSLWLYRLVQFCHVQNATVIFFHKQDFHGVSCHSFWHLELGPLIHLDSTQLFMEIQVNTLSALLHTNDVDHVNTQTSGW